VTRYEVPRTDLGAIDRDAVFNGEVAVAESASRLNVDRGAEVAVPVEWEVIGVPDSGRGFALHLRDARGLTWAQADVSGYLSEQWRVGDRVLAWFPLALDARMPPGAYEAFLLMVDESGTPFGWHGSATPGAAGGVEVKVADVVVSRARAGRQSPPALADGGSLGTLGGLTARSALMPEEALTPGSGFEVAIEWAKNGASAGPLSLVAVDSAGRRHDLGEVDAAYGYPVSQWEDGDVVLGRYGLRMPAALTGDSATLLVASGEDEVALGSLAVRAVERVFATPSTARPADTEFAPGARLIGYEIDPDGSTVAVTLYWRADEADLPAGKVFVHLHRGGAPAAQHDSEPAGGTRSFPSLVPGEVVADRHEIVLPPGETAEDLEVGVGIYDPGTGARWSVRGAVSTEDRLELGPVR
jgi:hypothetical protein